MILVSALPLCFSQCPLILNDIKVKRASIKEYLNSTEHSVTHTTSVLETHCPYSHCHPTLPKDVGRCKPIQGLCAMQR